MREEKTAKEMTALFISALVTLLISGLFGWIVAEKWPILTNEERITYLYLALGGGLLSGICWIVLLILVA